MSRNSVLREPDRNGCRLPLDLDRLELFVGNRVLCRAVGRFADDDRALRRCLLQARGSVDDITDNHCLTLDRLGAQTNERLASGDANPHLQVLSELRDPVPDRERGAHGALRIVLVSDRSAKHRHDGVADELLHGATEALQLGAQAQVVAGEEGAHVFGVELFGA